MPSLACDLGRYNVVLDESHFRDVLHQMVSPPAATVSNFVTFCCLMCHLSSSLHFVFFIIGVFFFKFC